MFFNKMENKYIFLFLDFQFLKTLSIHSFSYLPVSPSATRADLTWILLGEDGVHPGQGRQQGFQKKKSN